MPDPATSAEFGQLLSQATLAGPHAPLDYRLAAPKWQFLCHAADHGGYVLHGSGTDNIAEFEPRQSNDIEELGNRRAVYAASDGLWAMYFAIVDRDRYVTYGGLRRGRRRRLHAQARGAGEAACAPTIHLAAQIARQYNLGGILAEARRWG